MLVLPWDNGSHLIACFHSYPQFRPCPLGRLSIPLTHTHIHTLFFPQVSGASWFVPPPRLNLPLNGLPRHLLRATFAAHLPFISDHTPILLTALVDALLPHFYGSSRCLAWHRKAMNSLDVRHQCCIPLFYCSGSVVPGSLCQSIACHHLALSWGGFEKPILPKIVRYC